MPKNNLPDDYPTLPTTTLPATLTDAQLVERQAADTGAEVEVYKPRTDRDLQYLMDRAVTEDDWLAIFHSAKEMALGGGQVGIKAMEFLAKYRFGLPAQMTREEVQKQKPIQIVEVVKGQSVEQIENKSKPVEDESVEDGNVEGDGDVPL